MSERGSGLGLSISLFFLGVFVGALMLAFSGLAADLLAVHWRVALVAGVGLILARVKRPAIGIGIIAISVGLGLSVYDDLRLEKLRQTNPTAYLKEIQTADDAWWLEELEELDPAGFEAEMTRRATAAAVAREAAEAARIAEREAAEAARIAERERTREVRERNRKQAEIVEARIRKIPASDISANISGYKKLVRLNPDEPRYAEKLQFYETKAQESAARRKADAETASRVLKNPALHPFKW